MFLKLLLFTILSLSFVSFVWSQIIDIPQETLFLKKDSEICLADCYSGIVRDSCAWLVDNSKLKSIYQQGDSIILRSRSNPYRNECFIVSRDQYSSLLSTKSSNISFTNNSPTDYNGSKRKYKGSGSPRVPLFSKKTLSKSVSPIVQFGVSIAPLTIISSNENNSNYTDINFYVAKYVSRQLLIYPSLTAGYKTNFEGNNYFNLGIGLAYQLPFSRNFGLGVNYEHVPSIKSQFLQMSLNYNLFYLLKKRKTRGY